MTHFLARSRLRSDLRRGFSYSSNYKFQCGSRFLGWKVIIHLSSQPIVLTGRFLNQPNTSNLSSSRPSKIIWSQRWINTRFINHPSSDLKKTWVQSKGNAFSKTNQVFSTLTSPSSKIIYKKGFRIHKSSIHYRSNPITGNNVTARILKRRLQKTTLFVLPFS